MNIRRVYETTIIINAALEDPDVDAAINKISSFLENHGGVIEETNKWGRRRLAYPINKKFNGYYVHIVFNAQSNTIPAFERFLVLEDKILRHLTLQLEAEMREYRKEKSLAEGKSGETIISSAEEVERVVTAPFGGYNRFSSDKIEDDVIAAAEDAELLLEEDIIDEDE
jgi:small subunit ribosomal protein S6